jgi:hypothetical protein
LLPLPLFAESFRFFAFFQLSRIKKFCFLIVNLAQKETWYYLSEMLKVAKNIDFRFFPQFLGEFLLFRLYDGGNPELNKKNRFLFIN